MRSLYFKTLHNVLRGKKKMYDLQIQVMYTCILQQPTLYERTLGNLY